MTRAKVFPAILTIAALAALALAVWQYRRAEQAEEQLGLDAGRVLSAVFTQARELRVARLTGTALARSTNDGTLFRSEQETRAPFSVDYFVDLRKIGRDDYAWDSERRIMTVSIPDVTVEQPSVDMSRAAARVKGLWVSREAGTSLNRQASQRLAATASARAKADGNVAQARSAATTAVAGFVRQPLAAAGFDDVTVEVRFPWEGRRSPEQWDRSRRPEEVLRDNP